MDDYSKADGNVLVEIVRRKPRNELTDGCLSSPFVRRIAESLVRVSLSASTIEPAKNMVASRAS